MKQKKELWNMMDRLQIKMEWENEMSWFILKKDVIVYLHSPHPVSKL